MNPMYASMGLDLAQGLTGFAQASIASKLASKLQKYRNAMLEVSAAMSRSVAGLNKIATRDAGVRLQFSLQVQAAEDQGAARVAAAAAGVQGGSVDRTMRGLRQSAANAQAARKARTSAENRGHDNDLRNINVGAITGRDITVRSKPSLLAASVGIGKNLIDTYDRFQPEGDKLGDQLRLSTRFT